MVLDQSLFELPCKNTQTQTNTHKHTHTDTHKDSDNYSCILQKCNYNNMQ